MTEPPSLEFRLLGRFAVLRDGAEIPTNEFGGRKVRTLLRILATRRGSFVTNDALTEMLWPDRHPADPAANLQVLVTRARKALGDPEVIRTGPGGYALAGGASYRVDAEEFLAAVTAIETASLESLDEALAEWAGEPLAEDVYADWASDLRARVLRARQDALERAATLATEAGRPTQAVGFASAAADAEPLREAAVLALVRALAAAGDRAAALTRYDQYRLALADELGVDPSVEAAALHQQLLRGAGGAAREEVRRVPAEFTELPFVGREDDLRRIRATLAREGAGRRGATVSVVGESGSGKSRLVETLAARTPAIVARAVSPERAEPWSLMRLLLREILAEDIAYGEALPASLASALPSLLPELGGAHAAPADPQSLRALVQEAASRLLGAADQVIVVDDLQWADPTSLTVLETAAARLPDLRLMVAYRPEEVPDGGDVSRFLRQLRLDLEVELGPLTVAAVGDLVADADLASALAGRAGRAPMAISEVLRALAAEGMVARGPDGRWHGGGPGVVARAVELGRQGEQHAIATRAARQEPEARQLLDLICLLARETSVTTLAAASSADESDVLDRLGVLFRAGLVRLGESGWAAAHDMVGESITEVLAGAARARLHARLAAALEAEAGDPAELARHLLAAGESGRAADAFARAARAAVAAFADQEALGLAGSGLAAKPGPPVAGALLEVRAEARARTGDIPGARDDLRAALTGCERGPDRARLLGRLAILASGADDLVRAGELAELALVEAGTDLAARAGALEVASVLDMNLDRTERAAERSAAALELYRRLGDANGTARVLDARAMATFLDGDIRAGGAALRQAADLFEDSGDLVRVVTPRSTSGHALVFAGRAGEGLTTTTAALDLARTLGHPEGQAYALWHRAEALAALGRPAEALADGSEALAIATQIGHRGWTATSWRAVGIAHEAAGNLDEALGAHLQSLEVAEHLGLFASWAAARAALVLLALGDVDRARPLVARSLAEGPPLGHYEGRLAQAELAAATDDPHAAGLAREARARADAGGVRQYRERLVELAGG